MIARAVRLAQAASSTTSLLVLIGFNLLPLAGVLFGRWTVATLLVLYWVENGIVGLLNIPKILLAEGTPPIDATPATTLASVVGRVGVAAFFFVHYGIFWFVHGVFVWTLPAFLTASERAFDANGVPIVSTAASVDGSAVLWGAIGLTISHGVSFVVNFLGHAEYRKVTPTEQMGRPYARVVTLHLAILFGGILSLSIGSPIGALLVLVVLKTAIDVALHRREHDTLAARPIPVD